MESLSHGEPYITVKYRPGLQVQQSADTDTQIESLSGQSADASTVSAPGVPQSRAAAAAAEPAATGGAVAIGTWDGATLGG
ncbi:unnamed protein product [Urochloa humidicola]